MKKILPLIAIGFLFCSVTSAFQGGGGESPKKKTNKTKPVATNKATGPPSARTAPATISLSNRAAVEMLERSWNFYIQEKISLGPTYIGNTTSFARPVDSVHALALNSDYPLYRALARKGLITIDESGLPVSPPAGHPTLRIERVATIALTLAGAKLGTLDSRANTVTFVLGTYRVEKIASNVAIETTEGNYRLVQGTHVLDIKPAFSDVWAELGWPTYRERRFRVIFHYRTDLGEGLSQWMQAVASNGRFSAEDTGPRNGAFRTANVPPTLDQLRLNRR